MSIEGSSEMPRGQYERNPIAKAITQPAEASPALSQPSARAEEVRRDRRRRSDGDLDRMGRMALSIPPEIKGRLDREGKTCRWVRDASGRQMAMQREDTDVTPDVEPGTKPPETEGKPVLMEKYGDWYNDHQSPKTNLL